MRLARERRYRLAMEGRNGVFLEHNQRQVSPGESNLDLHVPRDSISVILWRFLPQSSSISLSCSLIEA